MKKSIIVVMVMMCMALLTMGLTGCGGKGPQTATLKLSANPTTGYEWRVEQDPEIFDINSEYAQDEADGEMVGVGGTETFTLTPKQEGSTKVSFYYEQPWEKGSLATELTYEISVDADMQIKVESQTGEIPGDESETPEIPEMVIE